MKKKIFISAAMVKDRHDGINEYLRQILSNYDFEKDVDYEYHVFVNRLRPNQLFGEIPGLKKIYVSSVNDNPIGSLLWHHFIMPLILLIHKADLVWIPTYRRIPYLCPCKIIATIHDIGFRAMKNKYGYLRKYLHSWITPTLLKKLNRIITVSAATKKDLVKLLKLKEDKITVVHSGIDNIYLNTSIKHESDEYRKVFQGYKPYILYVSRIEHPGKNHIALLKAYKRLIDDGITDYNLLLIGNNDRGSDYVHVAIKNINLQKRVKHESSVKGHLMPYIYRNAEIFVFPSFYEGFGFPILEAMASRVAVICSNTSSLPEIAGDAAYLIDPNNDQELYAALKLLLFDKARKQEYIEKGFARVSSFDWKITCRRTFDLLRVEAS